MKITATLAMLAATLMLTACASAPSDSAAPTATAPKAPPVSSAASAPAPAPQSAAGKAAPAKAGDQATATVKTKRVCENDDSTGSRLKRPRCYDVPEGSEKAYRDDLLREKEDELRSYSEGNALRSANPL